MSQCRFTAAASRDLEGIIDTIAKNSGFDAADRFLSQINAQCRRLAQFPGMGRRRDELSPSLRSFPFQFLDPIEVEDKYKHFLLDPGDIVASSSGTLGKTAIIQREDLPLMLNISIVRFRPFVEVGPISEFTPF